MQRGIRPLVVIAWGLVSLAWGACEPAASRNVLEVEGIGTAYFDDFSTDRASGSVSLAGDVCVEDLTQAWTIRADRVEITGLRSEPLEPRLFSEEAEVSFGPWRLAASTAVATTSAVTLAGVVVFGPDVAGRAASVRYDLESEQAVFDTIDLQGTVFRVWARAGTLDGPTLRLTDAVATTCACRSDPMYTVTAPAAEIDIVTGSFVLESGRLRALGLVVPLPERLELTGDLVEELEFPLVIGRQRVRSGDLGEGWTVAVTTAVEEGDLRATAGVTSLTTDPKPVLGLSARSSESSVVFALPADGFELVTSTRRELGSGFGVTASFEHRATPRADHLHQAVFGVDHRAVLLRWPEGGLLEVEHRAFGAISAQRLEAGPVAGLRLGARNELLVRSGATPAGVFTVHSSLAGTWYPDQAAEQWVASVTPSWRLDTPAVDAALRYRGRWVAGGSPYTASLDRASPQSLADGNVNVAWSIEGVDATLSLGATYDLLPAGTSGPGFTVAGAAASAAVPLGPGVWSARIGTDLAGLLGDRARTPPYLEGRAGYAWSGHALGVRTRYDLSEHAFTDVEVSVRARIPGEAVTLTPYVAVDIAPWWRSGAPELAGHGLELEWTSCCGTLILGYEQGSAGLTTRFSFRVDPRPIVLPEPAP